MAVVQRVVDAIRGLFSSGGGKGSRIISQNRAAKLGKSARAKAVRLPVAPGGKAAGRPRGGASAGGTSGS